MKTGENQGGVLTRQSIIASFPNLFFFLIPIPFFFPPCPLLRSLSPTSFSTPLFITWTKCFPAVTLVTGPYREELRIVYERDGERKRGASNAQNNASLVVGNVSVP